VPTGLGRALTLRRLAGIVRVLRARGARHRHGGGTAKR
jgi:hypothetical protein